MLYHLKGGEDPEAHYRHEVELCIKQHPGPIRTIESTRGRSHKRNRLRAAIEQALGPLRSLHGKRVYGNWKNIQATGEAVERRGGRKETRDGDPQWRGHGLGKG